MLYLKPLSPEDGEDIYKLLQEIGTNENGFHNDVYGKSYEEYRRWLAREVRFDRGELEDWMMPQSSYWLFDGRHPVGYGRLRHRLNDSLRETSGHIGYAIRSSERGRGYGRELLRLLVAECDRLGIDPVQVGANADNARSNRVILANGGVLIDTRNGKNFYHITRSTAERNSI